MNNGAIFERDISTVGGANTFARGLATVYQSGNFVIVLNNSSSASRHIRKAGWLASGYNSDIWDEAVLSQHSSDVYGSIEKKITPKNDFMDLRTFAYYGSLSSLVENTVSKILTTFPYELYLSSGYTITNVNIPMPSGTCYTIENPGNIDIYSVNSNLVDNENLGHFCNGGKDNYAIYFDDNRDPISGYQFTWDVHEISRYRLIVDNADNIKVGDEYVISGNTWVVCGVVTSKNNYIFIESFTPELTLSEDGLLGDITYRNAVKQDGPCRGMFFARIDISVETDNSDNIYKIYALWDKDLIVKYILNTEYDDGVVPTHIRPRVDMWFYDDFVDGLDLFGKCLIGEFSGIKNTANFEVLSEFDGGKRKITETFTFPTTNGGYNLESFGIQMEKYIKSLAKIGVTYDENYTDNLYRMKTHDSLKNLDWTNNFNGNDGDYDNIYINTGHKFSSIIRVMGYVFDQEKSYIDTIGYSNTITYSNRDNLSDYFLTDSLETDGWNITTIYPYELREYDSNNVDVTKNDDIWCLEEQLSNLYSRKFSEDTSTIISPYFGGPNAHYVYCSGSTPVIENISNDDYKGEKYGVVGGDVFGIVKDYSEQYQLTIPTINNEFMKRLRINSKQILRKKGTIESIESILSLFGLKSKRWAEAQNNYVSDEYDFDVEEYTIFTPPIIDEFDEQHQMHKINWYNSCKTIPYQTQSYLNGEYIDYQGLPIAYRESYGDRKLYPYFSTNGLYDGDMYYQMNGGWMNYIPYRFDGDDRMFSASTNVEYDNYTETLRNVGFVNNIEELVSQPISNLTDGVIYYVTDIGGEFALINGYLYPLKKTTISGNPEYYFEVQVFGSSVSIGGDLYVDIISVSDPNGTIVGRFNGIDGDVFASSYNLNIYSDGYVIRIYYTGYRNNAFLITSTSDYSQDEQPVFTNQPETSYLLSGGSYYENSDDFTHYFELVNVNYCDRIGDDSWRQINKNERIHQIIDTIVDNYEGNNPHSGNFQYDNGREYINRFKKLFKYASEYRLFNESCFPDVNNAYNEISGYGFSIYNEINGKELFSDTKVHAFVDEVDSAGTLVSYSINDRNSLIERGYGFVDNILSADGVTNQIINTKNIKITFYVNRLYKKDDQEYIKYIQGKIMPYVEQMIPSTLIVEVEFVPKYNDDICNNEAYDQSPNQDVVEESAPSPQESSPSPQESSPSPQESSPSPQESAPSPQESSPSPQESAPSTGESESTTIDFNQSSPDSEPSIVE